MTRALIVLMLASVSIPVLADDTNADRPVQSHKQMMKDCMAQERAANSGASSDAMKRTCRNKIQSYNNHPSETAAPPNNPTESPTPGVVPPQR